MIKMSILTIIKILFLAIIFLASLSLPTKFHLSWFWIILAVGVTAIVAVLIFPTISKFLNDRKTELEITLVIISLITVTSIIAGVQSIKLQQESLDQAVSIQKVNWERENRIKRENNRIYFENTRTELIKNLGIINFIKENIEELRTRPSTVANRFNFSYLEILSSIHPDKETREIIIAIVYDMKTMNHILDRIDSSTFDEKGKLFNDILKWLPNTEKNIETLINQKLVSWD